MNVTGALRHRGASEDSVVDGDSPSSGQPASGHSPDGGGARLFGHLDLARSTGWILALVGFIVGARVITDNSFLTHLATGNLILEQGSVPTVDSYSYLANGEGWTVQSWLVSIVYAVLDATAGGWSIRLMNGFGGAAITLGLWKLVSPARQLLTRVCLVSLALLIGTYLWPPRPLLVGLLATIVVLQVIQGQRPRWWLVPLFWIWVNSHGSFVLGCGLLGAVMVGAAIDAKAIPWKEVRDLAAGLLGCVVALINPLQWRLLWFPFHMMSRGEALDGVSEWASPSFRSPIEQVFLLLLVLIVISAVRGARWRTLLPALVFFITGLMAVRNLGLASLVIITLVAPSLHSLFGTLDGKATGAIPRLVAAVAGVGLAVSAIAVALSPPVDLSGYPIDEIEWLEERDLVANPEVRLAQRDYVGNYLTLRYGRNASIFMDDRFDFYPQEIIDDHNGLLLGGDFAEIVGRNEFDVVMWATETPFRRWLNTAEDWEIVVDGESWFVACRTTSPVYARCQP